MEDIKSGKINCIIVKDLSRLGRNYIEMGKYLEQIFPMMGIRFIAINDNYDNANTESSDSDSIVVSFKNLLNDSYCRDISIKVRSQLDMKRRNIPIFFQGVQRFVVQAVFEKLVLCYLLAAHSFPQRSKINQCCHHFCL